MSNIDMTITVTENLINKALEMYLRSIMSNLDNCVIKTNYTAGRGPNGITATIDIAELHVHKDQDVLVDEPAEQTISKISRVIPQGVLSTPKTPEPVEVTVQPVVETVVEIVTETVQPTVLEEEPVQEVTPKKSAFSISEVQEAVQEDTVEEPIVEATAKKKPRFNV